MRKAKKCKKIIKKIANLLVEIAKVEILNRVLNNQIFKNKVKSLQNLRQPRT
jgi:hypothetical protein